MDALTAFGLLTVGLMLVTCALGSVYGFLQGARPFGVVEATWSAVALRRWYGRQKSTQGVT
jgi:hypothetical protein